jgi:aspartokinase
MNQPFARQLASENDLPLGSAETAFEKARGVNRVEIRDGFASARVSGLETEVQSHRLQVLRGVYDAEVSFDFLKFTHDGLSFVVPTSLRDRVSVALGESGVEFEIRDGRSVLIVHAVNMRDEEGLVAKVVSEVIGGGATIEHMGEMHDRLLLLVESTQAAGARDALLEAFPEAGR